MIDCDKSNRDHRPSEDKPEPRSVSERRSVRIHIQAEACHATLPRPVAERDRDQVLNPVPSIAPRDPHQELDILHKHRNNEGRHYGCQREQDLGAVVAQPRHPNTRVVMNVEQTLQIVSKCDRNDWEIGAEREDRKQGEKVVYHFHENRH